jgi:signal transduction histidine kinase/ActR/RegA family two-component response regulator
MTSRGLLEILSGILFGRFSGAAIVGALLLTTKRSQLKEVFVRKTRSGLWCAIGAAMATAFVFGPLNVQRPIAWLVFPPLILAPFVGGSSLTSKILFIIAVGSVWGTTVGFGPFSPDPFGYAILKQFLAVVSVTGLVLAGTARERLDKNIAEQRAEDLKFLSSSAVELLLSGDIAASVQRCMPGLARRCDVDLVLYHRINGGGVDAMRRVADYGLERCTRNAAGLATLELVVGNVARAAKSGKSISERYTAATSDLPIELFECFPISDSEGLLGVISVGSATRSSIDPSEVKLIDTLVFYISAADQRLLREAERKALLERERAARMRAERADRSKNEFLAVLSHELRNPLNAIVGWTQLLQRGKVDVSRAAKIIEQSARLQSQLIEDLLDMSRIESGKLALTKAPLDLTGLVAGASEAMRVLAQEKGVELDLRLESDLKMAAADAVRVNQIVSNLLSNAIKFTPPKGRVIVSLRRRGAQALLKVADTGVGITEDFMPHLFDRFRQADQSTTRRYGGLGLGLAIAKHMTELHGGTIEAHSAGLNKGASFIVRLPITDQPCVVVSPDISETHRAETSDDVVLRGKSVIIVEDDTATLEMLARLLSDKGATVIACEKSASALEAIRSRRPDLIISDIGMPNLDGYELLRAIRRGDDIEKGPPAIALTAFTRPEDKETALSSGFDAHLAKPVNLLRLEELAKELLVTRSARSDHGASDTSANASA